MSPLVHAFACQDCVCVCIQHKERDKKTYAWRGEKRVTNSDRQDGGVLCAVVVIVVRRTH